MKLLAIPAIAVGVLAASSAHANFKTYDTSIAAFKNDAQNTPWRATSYGTSFETGEGFAPGYIGGQAGWTAFSASLAEGHVDTANPWGFGDQHLRIAGDPAVGAGSFTGGFSPSLAAAGSSSSYMSVWVNIGATGGADYQVIAQAPTQGFLSARVNFSYLGGITVLDDDGSGLAFFDTGATWTAGVYQHLEIMLDNNANTLEYYLDGALIYSGLAGVYAGTEFEQVIMLSDNWQAGEVGDFDELYFENIPAPGALALLGLAGLMGARRRR